MTLVCVRLVRLDFAPLPFLHICRTEFAQCGDDSNQQAHTGITQLRSEGYHFLHSRPSEHAKSDGRRYEAE